MRQKAFKYNRLRRGWDNFGTKTLTLNQGTKMGKGQNARIKMLIKTMT